ncbi:MAG: 2-amino-4-hydroxy-6-hydroxymethyldihydropteridine diphosphokinase [Eubacteriales bacterium]|jgi:dihydroneopterin aldolase/2-amino-4-hydroxy-6-hydroxymethyldihydropteridine diphosphokinase|nr:2-amino-4-hydroxy-6-hydroxymethyldihydropteridine diphosphokinase [Eubacteriales bacterium]
MRAALSIGSNMGDRRAHIEEALRQLAQRAGTLEAVSEFVETAPYGYTAQDDFLNGAVILDTNLQPHDLLSVIHDIEENLHRVRIIHWGPRTIDIDIVLFDDKIVEEDDLTIPHCDFRHRDFVLRPLAEIAPNWRDPVTGKTVAALLEALEASDAD